MVAEFSWILATPTTSSSFRKWCHCLLFHDSVVLSVPQTCNICNFWTLFLLFFFFKEKLQLLYVLECYSYFHLFFFLTLFHCHNMSGLRKDFKASKKKMWIPESIVRSVVFFPVASAPVVCLSVFDSLRSRRWRGSCRHLVVLPVVSLGSAPVWRRRLSGPSDAGMWRRSARHGDTVGRVLRPPTHSHTAVRRHRTQRSVDLGVGRHAHGKSRTPVWRRWEEPGWANPPTSILTPPPPPSLIYFPFLFFFPT